MTKAKKSLSKLVSIYRKQFAPRIAEYLGYFEKLESLDDAIRFGCLGKGGKIHGHQRRVGRAILTKASKKLLRHADALEACESFDDLLNCVKAATKRIERFGVLAVYDTSLRIGAKLSRWPEVVYLHAGTKKGCKALGVKGINGIVEMADLPTPVRKLEPYQAEDFLCIFKDNIAEDSKLAEGCLPGWKGVC